MKPNALVMDASVYTFTRSLTRCTRRKEKSPSEKKWKTTITVNASPIHSSTLDRFAMRYFLKSLPVDPLVHSYK